MFLFAKVSSGCDLLHSYFISSALCFFFNRKFSTGGLEDEAPLISNRTPRCEELGDLQLDLVSSFIRRVLLHSQTLHGTGICWNCLPNTEVVLGGNVGHKIEKHKNKLQLTV